MNVTEIMSRKVVCAAPECPLDDAIELFETHPFRHLPVISDGELVGIVSDRDVALATGWLRARQRNSDGGLGPKCVGQIMSEDLKTLSEESTAQEAAKIILKERIGALPVLHGGTVTGIVTSTDLLMASCDEALRSDWKLRSGDTVSSWMTSAVHTADPDMPLFDALDLCKEKGVRHLPVVEKGFLVGMVSDRDLRVALGQEMVHDRAAQTKGRLELMDNSLSNVMVRDVTAASVDCSLPQAVRTMLACEFSALPVQKDGRLVGILTHTDILRSCC